MRLFLLTLSLLLLASCTSGTSAIVRSLALATGNAQETSAPSAAGIRYLRISSEGNTAYLALGYVESNIEGNTEVWYSAKGEVLKLRNGRIIGTVGLATDWRDVRLPKLPRWSQIGHASLRYERSRDVMPDYRFNLTETITLRAIPAPKASRLQPQESNNLQWFEERITDTDGLQNQTALPPSLYAVDISKASEIVVYGETCLAENLCLAWQRLPEGRSN